MESNCNKETEKSALKIEAREYFDHLIKNGCNEYDDKTELYLPEWYNEELFARGQSYVKKYRLFLLSGMLSGLISVLAIPSILKILICTRQSSNAVMAYRRYVRTLFHVIAWHTYPLKPGSKSWLSIEMVRNRHRISSRNCEKSNAGRITQKDLALTQFGFMGFVCLGFNKMGIIDEEFHEATIHLWRVIGHLLGIKDEYNLCTNSWSTTEERLNIVREEIYKPALEIAGNEFNEMTKSLIDGLWPVNNMLCWECYLYLTKRFAECKGCEYFSDEHFGDDEIKQMEYYKLNYFHRFLVSYGIFLTKYLYKYNIIRYYINLRIMINDFFMYYFPIVAIYKYGIRWAYVRIFSDNEMKYHQD